MSKRIPHVRKGQRLRFQADHFNAMADAANAHAERQHAGGAPRLDLARPGMIRVYNNTGGDVAAFAVLGIEDARFAPSTVLESFQKTPVLEVYTPGEPDHVGRFVVTQEPIPDAAIGWAMVAGVTAVKIDVLDDDFDRVADICDGVTGYLTAGPSGTAGVLWREKQGWADSTGQQWAYVLLGTPNWFNEAGGQEYEVYQLEDVGGGVLRPTWDYVRMHD